MLFNANKPIPLWNTPRRWSRQGNGSAQHCGSQPSATVLLHSILYLLKQQQQQPIHNAEPQQWHPPQQWRQVSRCVTSIEQRFYHQSESRPTEESTRMCDTPAKRHSRVCGISAVSRARASSFLAAPFVARLSKGRCGHGAAGLQGYGPRLAELGARRNSRSQRPRSQKAARGNGENVCRAFFFF